MPQSLPPKRPLEQSDRVEIVNRLTGGVNGIIGDSSDLLFNRPAFIADDVDRSPLAAAVRALSRYNCRVWARADKSQLSTRVNTGNAELCAPYLDAIGELPEGESLDPPFTGGQCVGATYNVTINANTSAGPSSGTLSGKGPVTAAGTEPATGGPWRRFAVFADGKKQSNLNGSSVISSTVSIARPGGVPDNCGDPPPDVQAPGTITGGTPPPGSIEITVPGVGPVTVTLTLNEDGDPVFCIEELEVCFEVAIGDEGGEGAPPATPGDQGEAGDSDDIDGGQTESDDPTRLLVGVLVEVIDVPPRTKVRWNASGAYYAGLYYVYLGGDAGLAQSPEAALVANSQFFYAPEGSNRYRVTANDGVAVRVTPYWRDAE